MGLFRGRGEGLLLLLVGLSACDMRCASDAEQACKYNIASIGDPRHATVPNARSHRGGVGAAGKPDGVLV